MEEEEPRRVPLMLQQNSFSSLSERQWQAGIVVGAVRKVIAAVEDYLEKCINLKVVIATLERLMEREEAEVCLRYILKHAKRRGSSICMIFDTKEKNGHFVASRRRWLKYQGERVALQESWQNDWQDIKCEGIVAKAPPCPERTVRTPLPQQSASSNREEHSQWSLVEIRRKRRAAFEETAKRMLTYPEDSEDLKVGISELKEQLDTLEEGLSIMQIAQQARFGERQEVLEGMVEDKIRLQSKATERLIRYQSERDRARMLQRSGGSRRRRDGADTLDFVSFESCRSSVEGNMEEVSSESPRKVDEEEITPEGSWTSVAESEEKDGWRLEPEGETATPEVIVLWNEAEGVPVNPEGESHHERAHAKSTK